MISYGDSGQMAVWVSSKHWWKFIDSSAKFWAKQQQQYHRFSGTKGSGMAVVCNKNSNSASTG